MIVPMMEEKVEQVRAAERLLIERIRAGEHELFHDLIRPYERGAYILAYSILRNREDAEGSGTASHAQHLLPPFPTGRS